MDSLTQITLGAACGEIVGGRKIGNRAMLWGAVAGTIPDLDVFVGKLMDPVSDLAFHRGISHSFFFAITFSALLAWIAKSIYDRGWHEKSGVRYAMGGLAVLFMLFCVAIVFQFSSLASSSPNYTTIAICLMLVGVFAYRLWKYYIKGVQGDLQMSYKQWYLLIFIATVTHPILDCFTTYGTQLFQPFSNVRISWNNISVADPFYTLPFLIFVVWSAFYQKENRRRKILLYIGVGLSSAYMAYTFVNKAEVNRVFEGSLASEEIEYSRYLTTPSILNNILWHCVADGDTAFYIGSYSLLDKEPVVKDIQVVPKNDYLVADGEDDRTVKTLRWFSDHYNGFMQRSDGKIQVNDLRYGGFYDDWNDPDSYIFKFMLEKQADGTYLMEESIGGPPEGDQSDIFKKLFDRVKGI